ncbi:MAG: mucoidy inhibitor MuiA family protein [Flavobacteriales bacterium]|nr:mucoidy inhibitor MuiA family protein [Flavobacteriales bacterium]
MRRFMYTKLLIATLVFPLSIWGNFASKLDSALVFLQGAEIYRSLTVDLKEGVNLVEINNLPLSLDEASIQVRGITNGTIQSVKFEQVHKEGLIRNDQWKKDELIVKRKELELMKCQAKLEALIDQENVLKSNYIIRNDKTGIEASTLAEGADYFHQNFETIYKERLKYEKREDSLKKELEISKKSMNILEKEKLNNYGKIIIAINANRAVKQKIIFSYFYQRAGWNPQYDLKVKNLEYPLELVYKAAIFQSTGEDWIKIPIQLSTINPNFSGEKPELTTWIADRYGKQEYDEGKAEEVQFGKVQGYVLSQLDDSPLGLVKVDLFKGTEFIESTFTDVDGYYAFATIPHGSYKIEFSYFGMNKRYSWVNINREDPITSNTKLESDFVKRSWAIDLDGELAQIEAQNRLEAQRRIEYEKNAPSELFQADYAASQGYARAERSNYAEAEEARRKSSEEYAKRKAESEALALKRKELSGLLSENDWKQLEYKLKDPVTILTDGKEYIVDIESRQVPVIYSYYAAPKIVPAAFLFASIPDWDNLSLRPGLTNVYMNSKYVGQTDLNLGVSDTLEVGLGRDDQIIVSRNSTSKESDVKLLGTKRTENVSWKIEVKNNKNAAIDLELVDQFPISENKDVEVKLLNNANAKVDEKKGTYNWKLNLGHGESKTIEFSYELVYPKNREIYLY